MNFSVLTGIVFHYVVAPILVYTGLMYILGRDLTPDIAGYAVVSALLWYLNGLMYSAAYDAFPTIKLLKFEEDEE